MNGHKNSDATANMNGHPNPNGHSAANGHAHPGEELWRHPDPSSTQMWEFLTNINRKYNLNLTTYEQLHNWSIDHVSDFWAQTWHGVGIRASKPFTKVCTA